jgi:hypothetical protein
MRLPSVLGLPVTDQKLQVIAASVMTGYHTEHTVDDAHGTIHATGAVFERSRTVAMGAWTSFGPLPVTSFAGSAAAWTVSVANQTFLRYMLLGETAFVQFSIDATTVTAGSIYLAMTLPPVLKPVTGNMVNPCLVADNGTFSIGFSQTGIGNNGLGELRFLLGNLANWAASAAATYARGTAIFKLENP